MEQTVSAPVSIFLQCSDLDPNTRQNTFEASGVTCIKFCVSYKQQMINQSWIFLLSKLLCLVCDYIAHDLERRDLGDLRWTTSMLPEALSLGLRAMYSEYAFPQTQHTSQFAHSIVFGTQSF